MRRNERDVVKRGSWRVVSHAAAAITAGVIVVGGAFAPASVVAGEAADPVPSGVNPVNGRQTREEVFEFAQKPAVARKGGTVTITFASKGACDAAVAIVDKDGKIVRHLAAGVLGKNAPWPFTQNSLSQSLEWDGKDNRGRSAPAGCRAKVSLGLGAEYDASYGGDRRNVAPLGAPVSMICDPEGNLIVMMNTYHHPFEIRILDRNGQYVRTLAPFPANTPAGEVPLVKFTTRWDGLQIPVVGGHSPMYHITPKRQTMVVTPDCKELIFWSPNHAWDAPPKTSVLKVGLDGSWKKTHRWLVGGARKGVIQGWKAQHMAISPDGKWLYFGSPIKFGQHAVFRAPVENPGAVAPYLGEVGKAGADDTHFNRPTGVACDKDGNLYVSDFVNKRIQVFSPDKKLLRSIPFENPEQLLVHPKTGRIYVMKMKGLKYDGNACGWPNWICALTPEGVLEATVEFKPFGANWVESKPGGFCLDPSGDEPAIWINSANGLKRYVDKGKSFELSVDLGKLVADDRAKGKLTQTPWDHAYIEVDPVREIFYVRDGGTCSGSKYHKVDGRTGKVLDRPGYEIDEMSYNRHDDTFGVRINHGNAIVKIDAETGKEIPLAKGAPVKWGSVRTLKGIPIPFSIKVAGGGGRTFQDGFCVAPNGDFYFILDEPQGGKTFLDYLKKKTGLGAKIKHIYHAEHLQVYSKDGELKQVSALPGLQTCSGIRVTRAGKVMIALNIQPEVQDDISDGMAKGTSRRADWGTLVQFDSTLDTFPVGKLLGTWDDPLPEGKAEFRTHPDGAPSSKAPRGL
ncbi:hypothetical protein ACFL01_04285, partial [Planctomycetota bacterium]